MLVNIANRYDALPSTPRSYDIVFYSRIRPDFMFDAAGPVSIVGQSIRRPLSARWALSRNMVTAPLKCGFAEPWVDHSFAVDLDMSAYEPGFYDLRMSLTYSQHEQASAITTFGWRIGEESHIEVCPSNFNSFWSHALQNCKQTPPDLRVEAAMRLTGEAIGRYNVEQAALPESYDPDGELYNDIEISRVDFASPCGGRVYGWFARPAGDGIFPGLLVMPGAGNFPRPAPVEQARHGYAALDIQVHGFPVDAPMYPLLPEPVYTDPQDYLHYRVYLNALQAVNALCQLPGVDDRKIAIVGGSQGGRLSTVVSALDPRICATVPAITHFANLPWLRWTMHMNRSHCPGGEGFQERDIIDDSRTRVESYFDVVNFAPYVKCPVLMNAGLIDPISPPTGVYAAYRALKTQKRIVPLPNLGHDWSPVFDRYAWTWLRGILSGHDTAIVPLQRQETPTSRSRHSEPVAGEAVLAN